MAALTYSKLFEPTLLTTSAATLFTVASPNLFRAGILRLTNYTAGAITVTVHAVPSGGSASDTNAIVKGKSIAATEYLDIALPIMKAGDFLQALASANTSISAHLLQGVLQA